MGGGEGGGGEGGGGRGFFDPCLEIQLQRRCLVQQGFVLVVLLVIKRPRSLMQSKKSFTHYSNKYHSGIASEPRG